MRYSGTVVFLAQSSLTAPFLFAASTEPPSTVSGNCLHNYPLFPDCPTWAPRGLMRNCYDTSGRSEGACWQGMGNGEGGRWVCRPCESDSPGRSLEGLRPVGCLVVLTACQAGWAEAKSPVEPADMPAPGADMNYRIYKRN